MDDKKDTMTAEEWVSDGEIFTRKNGQGIFYRRDGSGPSLVLLHGYPTWSYDDADVTPDLARDFDVIAVDFLGYGSSDKPRDHAFSVSESADTVEELLAHLGVQDAALVIHDYGGIVGQEILDRRRRDALTFNLTGVHILNCGIVYAAYRPIRKQKLLLMPVLGRFFASMLTKERMFPVLNTLHGDKKTHAKPI